MLAAYIDGSLSAAERRQFEEMLAQDPGLQADLEQQQAVRQMLSQVPQRRVPRNFTLDPALYGRPAKQPLIQYYPALRAATVLTAVMLFLAVGAGVITRSGVQTASVPASNIAMEASDAAGEAAAADTSADSAAEPAPVEGEVMVEEEMEEEAMAEEAPALDESTAEDADAEAAAEMPAEEAVAEEEAAEEPPAEEPAVAVTAVPEILGTPDRESGAEIDAADEESGFEAGIESTLPPLATASPAPTASSGSPRIEPTDELALRRYEAETAEAVAQQVLSDQATAEAAADGQGEIESETITQLTEEAADQEQGFSLVTWLQIGLVALLVVLAALTLYARRQLS